MVEIPRHGTCFVTGVMQSRFVRWLTTTVTVLGLAVTSLATVVVPSGPACEKMGSPCEGAAVADGCCCPEHTPATTAPPVVAAALSQVTKVHWDAVSWIDDVVLTRSRTGLLLPAPVPGRASPRLHVTASERLTVLLI